jgi:hypothetical protein
LVLGTFKEADERLDGCSELGFAGGLRGGILCLEVAIKGGYEDAVDVVGLEAHEGARVWDDVVMINAMKGCMLRTWIGNGR